jgi:hypothetical protein
MALMAATPAAARSSKPKVTAGTYHYVGIASAPNGPGYWLATSRGNVFQKNGAPFHGSPVSQHMHLSAPVVGIASSGSVQGYWLVTNSGRVRAFGKAHNYGSLNQKPSSPIVAIAATRGGGGYWLVSASGKVYRFGGARQFGSIPASRQHSPVVAIMVAQKSQGYWLVTASGGVFNFGQARFYGSLIRRTLTSRVVSAAATAGANGYWLATADGGVFNFGKAPFKGSAIRTRHAARVTSIAAAGPGYRLLRVSGKVLTYGVPVPPPVNTGTDPLKPGTFGYDISWPECGNSRPNASNAFVIIGINDGHAFSTNPCLASEWRIALASPNHWLYMNTDNPGLTGSSAFRFGEQAAQQSLNTAGDLHIASSTMIWLDVETTNQWSGGTSGNTQVILGFIHQLTNAKRLFGIYSTGFQWGQITGGFRLTTPTPQWVPGAPSFDMPSYCTSSKRFAAGTIWMTQSSPGNLDFDYACGHSSAATAQPIFSLLLNHTLSPVSVLTIGPGASPFGLGPATTPAMMHR